MAQRDLKKEMSAAGKGADTPDIAAFVERLQSGRRASDHIYALLLGIRELETATLKKRLERGLSFRAFEHLSRNMTLSHKELADLAHINYRTLNRRRSKGRLEPEESDRVLRVGRVFGRTVELFEGDQEAARRWLLTPQRALDGETPAEHAKTEFGALEVERLIDRLEHGVFS